MVTPIGQAADTVVFVLQIFNITVVSVFSKLLSALEITQVHSHYSSMELYKGVREVEGLHFPRWFSMLQESTHLG